MRQWAAPGTDASGDAQVSLTSESCVVVLVCVSNSKLDSPSLGPGLRAPGSTATAWPTLIGPWAPGSTPAADLLPLDHGPLNPPLDHLPVAVSSRPDPGSALLLLGMFRHRWSQNTAAVAAAGPPPALQPLSNDHSERGFATPPCSASV